MQFSGQVSEPGRAVLSGFIFCFTTPLLWCYSTATLQSYIITYFYTSLVYYIIQNVLRNKKIENKIFLFNKNKAAFMLIYWFLSSFRMGDTLPGCSPIGLQPTGQDSSPKRMFCRAVVPKEDFLDADWSVCVTWSKQQRWPTS